MMILKKYAWLILSATFGLAVFFFWYIAYPHALVYQEQFQLFLFDTIYMQERLIVPGGAAAYVSEFLTQYYNQPVLGALIQALLLLSIQWIVWKLIQRRLRETVGLSVYYVLSFLPSLVLWLTWGDESVLPAYALSLLVTFLAMWGFSYRSSWTLVLSVPLLYWMVGPLVLMFVLYVFIDAFGHKIKRSMWIGLFALIYAIVCIVCSAEFLPYPLRRLFVGIFYYRYVDVLPYSLLVIPVIGLSVIFFRLKCWEGLALNKRKLVTVISLVLVGVFSAVVIPLGYDDKTYELMEYDYLVRRQQWDAVIAKAEEKQPDLPMSVCATNLALGMKNQLGLRMFSFYQHGVEGMLPAFERDFTSTILTGEVYFQLGLVNTAQRYAFEAMEAIPNYNKSGRLVKRLAETNLINGQYEVAKKYLHMLEKTVFYRRWALDKLRLITDEKLIDMHPLYGKMRQIRLTDDFLFSDIELDKIFGQLFMHHPNNPMAIQYLLMYPLLNKDIDTFMRYWSVVQNKLAYNPLVCQEAIAFAYMQRQQNPPAGWVNEDVMRRLKLFAQIYTSAGKNSTSLEAFRGTLWYYLMKE